MTPEELYEQVRTKFNLRAGAGTTSDALLYDREHYTLAIVFPEIEGVQNWWPIEWFYAPRPVDIGPANVVVIAESQDGPVQFEAVRHHDEEAYLVMFDFWDCGPEPVPLQTFFDRLREVPTRELE